VSARQGNYQLPEISFSFFDPATNSYKKLTTPAQQLYITHEEKAAAPVITEKKTSIADTNRKASLIAGSIIIGAVLITLIYWVSRKKEVKPVAPQPAITYQTPAELLANAYMLIPAADNSFYRVLQRATWDFFRQHFDFAGSSINKHSLAAKLDERNVDPQLNARIMNVLQQCETGIYTGVVEDEDRQALLSETKNALDEIHAYLLMRDA